MSRMPGTILLTYDDGLDPAWTPRVLAALDRHGAPATFFVQARRAVEHPDLVVEIVAAGHEVGFHCLDHVRHSQRSRAGVASDLRVGLAMLRSEGLAPRAWRAPWGIETEATRELAAANDLRLWGWNVDTHDWRGDTAAEMWAAVEAQGGLRHGDVVLMHDALGPGARREGCAETVALTERLLGAAAGLGLGAATVSASDGVAA